MEPPDRTGSKCDNEDSISLSEKSTAERRGGRASIKMEDQKMRLQR